MHWREWIKEAEVRFEYLGGKLFEALNLEMTREAPHNQMGSISIRP